MTKQSKSPKNQPKKTKDAVVIDKTAQASKGATTDNTALTANTDNTTKPTSTDNTAKPASSDNSTKPSTTANATKPASTDNMAKPAGTDNATKPSVTASATKPAGTDKAATPASADQANKPANIAKTLKIPKTGALWFFTVINLLVLILICAAAAWYYTQIYSVQSNEQADISALKTELKTELSDQSRALQSDLGQLKQSSQSLENNIATVKQASTQNLMDVENQLTQKIASVQNEMAQASNIASALNKRLAEMSGRRPSDWLLAEANYLVNMAGRKLYLEKDVGTSVTLLKEADARLNDLNDPSLFSVRALISADIQALGQTNPVSTAAIALELAGMLPSISELVLNTLRLPENSKLDDLTLTDDVNDWRLNLKKTWQSIVDDLISIDYVDQPLEPYLAQRQQWLIEQQLNYALTQAQTAALNEQLELYRSAIQRGIDLLEEHYILDEVKVSQFLNKLKELQDINFSRDYPTSLRSQASLQSVIEKRLEGLYNNASTPLDNTRGDAQDNAQDNPQDDVQDIDQGSAQ